MNRFAIEFEEIANNGGTDKRVFEFGHQIDRFDIGIEGVVKIPQLKFKFKITHRTKSANKNGSSECVGELDREIVKSDNLNPFKVSNCQFNHINPFLQREHRLFFMRIGDGDDHFVEEFDPPLDNVKMTVGDRIEGSGVKGNFMHNKPYSCYLSSHRL